MNFIFSILLSQPHRTEGHSSFIIFLLKCMVTTTFSLIYGILFLPSSFSHVFFVLPGINRGLEIVDVLFSLLTFLTLSVRHQNITVKFVKQSKTKSMKLSKNWKVKVRTGTENLNNNYTKIAQRKHTWGGKRGKRQYWPPYTGQQKLDT